MSVIEFKPSAWGENIDKDTPQSPQYRYSKAPQIQQDSFGYLDEIIEDEKPSGFFAKLRSFFGKEETKTNATKTYSQEDAYSRAFFTLKEALVTKRELTKLIFNGVKNDYEDLYNHAGNLITFAQDSMGRGVMTEYDSKNKPVRRTTFALNDGSIYRFEEAIPNSNSYNKTIFFNYNNSNIEVHKGVRDDKVKELYNFEGEKPTYYKKDCVMTSNGAIAKEEYYF